MPFGKLMSILFIAYSFMVTFSVGGAELMILTYYNLSGSYILNYLKEGALVLVKD